MEWQHSASPHTPLPKKNAECKSLLEKFLPQLFGINTASSSLIISKGPNYQYGVLLIFAGAIERHFERKMLHAGRSTRWSCFCMTLPWLTELLAARINWPTWASNVLITDPILKIWPYWTYHLFPGLKKTIGTLQFFI
jgi:hypothetical protein